MKVKIFKLFGLQALWNSYWEDSQKKIENVLNNGNIIYSIIGITILFFFEILYLIIEAPMRFAIWFFKVTIGNLWGLISIISLVIKAFFWPSDEQIDHNERCEYYEGYLEK